MTPTIIIDFDDPRRGADALALARSLGELTGARFVTVTSYLRDRYGMLPVNGWHWSAPEQTQAGADLARSLTADDPGAITRVVGATSPARALHETAEREQADLIVVSSEAGTQPGRIGAGARGQQVLHAAPCAVAVAPAGFADDDGDLAPIGAAFDGSFESRLALASAAGLSDAIGGDLRVISVLERPRAMHSGMAFVDYHRHLDRRREECRSRLLDAIEALAVKPNAEALVIEGEPRAALTEHSCSLGLLVVGSRGYGPRRRVLLGGVSEALLDHARCPLMIIPRGVDRPFGATILHAPPARSH